MAVAVAPPRLQKRVLSPEATYRATRRTLTIRHVSGHRIVALVEVVSPGNKDRATSVDDFVDEVVFGTERRLSRRGRRPRSHLDSSDPCGLHEVLWDRYGGEEAISPEQPLILASYAAGRDFA